VIVARKIRQAPRGAIHHVVNRGNRRDVIFRKSGDYAAFVEVLTQACSRFEMRLLAFCVMPNHWHLVLWPPEHVSILHSCSG
jgi:putative transposase